MSRGFLSRLPLQKEEQDMNQKYRIEIEAKGGYKRSGDLHDILNS